MTILLFVQINHIHQLDRTPPSYSVQTFRHAFNYNRHNNQIIRCHQVHLCPSNQSSVNNLIANIDIHLGCSTLPFAFICRAFPWNLNTPVYCIPKSSTHYCLFVRPSSAPSNNSFFSDRQLPRDSIWHICKITTVCSSRANEIPRCITDRT